MRIGLRCLLTTTLGLVLVLCIGGGCGSEPVTARSDVKSRAKTGTFANETKTGLKAKQQACPGGSQTTVTGTVFAPNGTLYISAADLGPTGNLTGIALKTLNPANAAILSSVPTSDFFGALGIRPTDGVIFGGTGDQHQLFTVNPVTGAEMLVGDTGRNFVGDLDFQVVPAQPVPEPGTGALLAFGLLVVAWAHRHR